MAERTCEYACPGDHFPSRVVGPGAVDIQGTEFDPHTGENRAYAIPGSGCLLKAHNKGEDGLKLEIIDGRRVDITCVGPDSPLCPRNKFELVKEPRILLMFDGKTKTVLHTVTRRIVNKVV